MCWFIFTIVYLLSFSWKIGEMASISLCFWLIIYDYTKNGGEKLKGKKDEMGGKNLCQCFCILSQTFWVLSERTQRLLGQCKTNASHLFVFLICFIFCCLHLWFVLIMLIPGFGLFVWLFVQYFIFYSVNCFESVSSCLFFWFVCSFNIFFSFFLKFVLCFLLLFISSYFF